MLPDVTARTVASAGHMLPVTHVSEILPLLVEHCARQSRRLAGRRELLERIPA
jgi:hypothetical protein